MSKIVVVTGIAFLRANRSEVAQRVPETSR
jgi:hypothetical protein